MQFITVPNQRVVTINKPSHKKGDYTTIGISSTLKTMKELSYSGFMLYCYFMLNADGFKQILSPSYIYENTALTKNTYHKAFHELERLGYLVQNPDAKTLFDFFESPKNSAPCAEKHDNTYQKTVENINKQHNITSAQAPSLDATGLTPVNDDELRFFDF